MKYVVNKREMQEYDKRTIEHLKIPALVLMERAALQVADTIFQYLPSGNLMGQAARVLILAGCGNNGGDGLAVARLLAEKNYAVDTVLIGNREHCTEQTKRQLLILENYGLSVVSNVPEGEYDIIVDALFGIGLGRNLTGSYESAIEAVNQKKAYKIAVDIPSGVDADSGKVLGTAFRADITITFGFLKRGLLLYPGAFFAGKICCVDMGITERSFLGEPPKIFTYTEPVSRVLGERKAYGNKGTFGKVLLIAGSRNMAGAALLAGESALRTGAGMVKIVTCEENRIILQKNLPEAMLLTYPDSDFPVKFEEAILWADCVAIGPGLSQSTQAKELVEKVLRDFHGPLVIDADALNLLSEEKNLQELLKKKEAKERRQVVMTPHPGELARLLNSKVDTVKEDLLEAAHTLCGVYGCTVVGKDARTFVYQENYPIFLNTAGNSGMATAGSGDVLTGMIAGLCAGNKDAYKGAVGGVYLHAVAGDVAAEKKGEASLLASDIVDSIGEAWKNGGRPERYEYERR